MKRYLITALIAGSLVACSQGADTPEPDTNQNETEQQEPKNNNESPEQNSQQEENADSPEDKLNEVAELPDIPDEITKTVVVEGMEEERTYLAVHHMELGLSTYIPGNMIVEKDDNALKLYYSNTEGEKIENATYQIIAVESEVAITEQLEEKGFEIKPSDQKNYEDSLSEFSISNDSIFGYGRMIEHKEQTYAIVYYYPGEFGDGFEPTAQVINEEMLWHDEMN